MYIKDPMVHVQVWWIMKTQKYPPYTIATKYFELDKCGHLKEEEKLG